LKRKNKSSGPGSLKQCWLAQNVCAAIQFKRLPHCPDGLVSARISECHRPVRRNTHETIALVHDSFALLISLLFSGDAWNRERSHQKGLGKWDGIKQRLLIWNQFCFGCKSIGRDRRCVSIRLEQCRKDRGTIQLWRTLH
jgi:hypothetical protein